MLGRPIICDLARNAIIAPGMYAGYYYRPSTFFNEGTFVTYSAHMMAHAGMLNRTVSEMTERCCWNRLNLPWHPGAAGVRFSHLPVHIATYLPESGDGIVSVGRAAASVSAGAAHLSWFSRTGEVAAGRRALMEPRPAQLLIVFGRESSQLSQPTSAGETLRSGRRQTAAESGLWELGGRRSDAFYHNVLGERVNNRITSQTKTDIYVTWYQVKIYIYFWNLTVLTQLSGAKYKAKSYLMSTESIQKRKL